MQFGVLQRQEDGELEAVLGCALLPPTPVKKKKEPLNRRPWVLVSPVVSSLGTNFRQRQATWKLGCGLLADGCGFESHWGCFPAGWVGDKSLWGPLFLICHLLVLLWD